MKEEVRSLENAAKGSAQNISDGKVELSKKADFAGAPALDAVITGKDQSSGREIKSNARYVLDDRTLYIILGLGEDSNNNQTISLTESFKLL